jgi:hypothetical protein
LWAAPPGRVQPRPSVRTAPLMRITAAKQGPSHWQAKAQPGMAGAIPGRLGRVCLAYSARHPRLPVQECGGRGGMWGPGAANGDLAQIEASSCESRSDTNLRAAYRRVDCTPFSALTDHGNVGIDPAENGQFQSGWTVNPHFYWSKISIICSNRFSKMARSPSSKP